MSNNQARCLLCPRYCELEDDQIGACHARINWQGEICPSSYGIISALAVEPIEKKPLMHFLPGTKTLSLGGYGCNLECRYCENNNISQVGPLTFDRQATPSEVIETAKERLCESVCMTYNEPTLAIEYLLELGEKCHENDLKFIIKTNAYINQEPWEEVCKVVDAMNIDYKGSFEYFEDVTQCRYKDFGRKITTALNNDVHVELSIPVMPGYGDEDSYFWPLEIECAEVGTKLHCHLLKINPAHLMINSPTTSDEDIERARKDLSYIFPEEYIHV
jgi:pyruvate formate lyase activating enzyme